MKKYLFVLALIIMPSVVKANENEAFEIANADAKSLPVDISVFIRYLLTDSNDFENVQALAFASNAISRGVIINRPMPLKAGVIRIDLRHYFPKVEDLNEAIKTWEELRFDPKFSILLTKDTIKFLDPSVKIPLVNTWEWVESTKTWKSVQVEFKNSKLDVLRIAPSNPAYLSLAAITRSQAPIVHAPYFITRALTTIQGKGVFKTIYGGLYYQFAGIKKNNKKGTDFDNLLEQLGIGNIAAGITAEKLFESLTSDRRVAVFRSKVTGKPRRVDVFRTLLNLDGESIVSVTHDIGDDDIDIGTHPVMNLIAFKDKAREVIFTKKNGLHGFALFNGDGVLQDEVPFDVAMDSTIPTPYTQRLQPGIGCIRCHGKHNGWQPLENDVKKLLDKIIDVFGDNEQKKDDVFDRLAGLYSGNLEQKILPRARDDYANVMLRATGPWKRSKDQVDIVVRASDKVSDIFRAYNYELIDARRALKELSIPFDENQMDMVVVGGVALDEINKKALKKLREVLPPLPVKIDGIIPEDPRIGALLTGLSINRSEWDLVYNFVTSRIKIKELQK